MGLPIAGDASRPTGSSIPSRIEVETGRLGEADLYYRGEIDMNVPPAELDGRPGVSEIDSLRRPVEE